MYVVLLTLLTLLAATGRAGSQDLVLTAGSGELRDVTLVSETLDGTAASRSIDVGVDAAGKLWVWARSGEVDVELRLVDASGRELARSVGAAGRSAASAQAEVDAWAVTSVHVSASSEVTAELHLALTAESAETLAICERVGFELADLDAAAADPREIAARLESLVDVLLDTPGGSGSHAVCERLVELGHFAQRIGAPTVAEPVWRAVLELRERTLPDEHADLQRTRNDLAAALFDLGQLQQAADLQARVLEWREKVLPEGHADLFAARLNLAWTLKVQGRLDEARRLLERSLALADGTLPEGHPYLQYMRANLAGVLNDSGDLEGATELYREVHDLFERTLAPESPDLLMARQNLAAMLVQVGELERARELEEEILRVRERTLAPDAPDLQLARLNLASTLKGLGELEAARDLEWQVLEVRARTQPPDSPELLHARFQLGTTLSSLGESSAARTQLSAALAGLSRVLPEDHLLVQAARTNLAIVLAGLGDFEAARELDEAALASLSRTHPDDHAYLQSARLNLAITLQAQGDDDLADALRRKVVEVFARTLDPEDPRLWVARANLVEGVARRGDLDDALRQLREIQLELEALLPPSHPTVLRLGTWHAELLARTGDLHAAQALLEELVDDTARELPEPHDVRKVALAFQAAVLARLGDADGARAVALETSRLACLELRKAALTDAPREVGARAGSMRRHVSRSLALARELGGERPDEVLLRDTFTLIETLRSAELLGPSALAAADDDRGPALRRECMERAHELAVEVRRQATDEELRRARSALDDAWRTLVTHLRGSEGGRELLTAPTPEALAARADPSTSLVAYWRVQPAPALVAGGVPVPDEDHLWALVVEADGELTALDLGPADAIARAAEAWRATLGVSAGARGVGVVTTGSGDSPSAGPGERLRELVLDPVLADTAGSTHLVVALDDALHSVALDALPLGTGIVGDRLSVEVRTSLWELLRAETPVPEDGVLVALGGIDYDVLEGPVASLHAGAQRSFLGSGERAFAALPASEREVERIADLFRDTHDREPRVLTGDRASVSALLSNGPHARYLHVATHGWFAPDLPEAGERERPLDVWTGVGRAMRREQRVRGLSPWVLCGLALAGANSSADHRDRVPGTITAEEIATINLSGCELAVLSACETHLGVRRAGRGLASLQLALQAAGARSVLTSLWKVSDEATEKLMVEFYRRAWGEGQDLRGALWDAKQALRAAGHPELDWAGWVLTGDR